MREFITPNWHAVLVHAPLGLLSAGIIIEIFSFLWRQSSARIAGRWMILIGAITAVPALTSGIYAYRDAISPVTNVNNVEFDTSWHELLEGKLIDRASVVTGEKAKEITAGEMLASDAGKALWHHLLYNCIGVGAIFLAIIAYIGCSDLWRRRLYLPLLLTLVIGKGLLIWGSHSGGIAVYEHAVAIKPPTPKSTIVPTRGEQLSAVLPPAQLHMTLAGWVVGMAFVALGLSIRAMTEGTPNVVVEEEWFEGEQPRSASSKDVVGTRPNGIIATGAETLATEGHLETVPLGETPSPIKAEMVRPVVIAPTVPLLPIATSRYWLLATAFALATSVAGLWLIKVWDWPNLLATLKSQNRNMYHSILGTSIIVLTLVLALVTRIARRSKLAISIFSVLLFLAIGLQMWMGIVLTFDGPRWKVPKVPKVPKGTTAGLIDPFRINAKPVEKD